MAVKLGPGLLTIGETGGEIDVSCDVNNAKIAMSKDQGDSKTKLCGIVQAGSTTYTYALSGNIDQDLENGSEGFFALSQAEPGSEQPFKFTPNTENGTTATGVVVIDPLDFGGEETGEDMTSDFEFALVGSPAYDYGEATPPGDDSESEVDSVSGSGVDELVGA